MQIENRHKLTAMLQHDEMFRQFPYTDSTGNLTVGIGRCLDKKGISLDEALYLLNNDVTDAEHDLLKYCPVYSSLDDARKCVLISMVFELGIHGFMQFKTFLWNLEQKDWSGASEAMKASLWHAEVGDRADRLAHIILTGEF